MTEYLPIEAGDLGGESRMKILFPGNFQHSLFKKEGQGSEPV